ncbi:MAG: endonuclease domain-containing protein [Defluviitaleaceae bacterium]|nr:endonuclease domain-containing protein [Defluviitaleaceae bacterium]
MADLYDEGVMVLPRNKELKQASKMLRKNATVHEDKLWRFFLKDVKPRFFRQRVIGNYIVDFYCHSAKLVIELDGYQHNEPEAIEYDKVRTEYLNSLGLSVMRFSNSEVENNFALVCKTIKRALIHQS